MRSPDVFRELYELFEYLDSSDCIRVVTRCSRFEALGRFLPCSFGFRPKKTPRMALSAIVQSVNDAYFCVVDVVLRYGFILPPDHESCSNGAGWSVYCQ